MCSSVTFGSIRDAFDLILLFQFVDSLAQLQLAVAQLSGELVLLRADGRFLLALHRLEAPDGLLQRRRRSCLLETHPRGRLVDEVDRLVGQEPVGDVASGQLGRGLQRLVGDHQLVVLLVALLDAAQDLDRLLDRRLVDLDGLEASLERGVTLDVLAVLVERSRADGLQLATGEGWLQDVGGVDRALGRAGSDEGVQLVDEEHAVARRS